MSELIFQFRNTAKIKHLWSITDLFVCKGNRFVLSISFKRTSIQHNINFIFFFLTSSTFSPWSGQKYVLCRFSVSSSLAPAFSHFIGDERIGDFFKMCQIHVYVSLNVTETSWSIRFFIASNYLHYLENLWWWYYMGWVVGIHFSM